MSMVRTRASVAEQLDSEPGLDGGRDPRGWGLYVYRGGTHAVY